MSANWFVVGTKDMQLIETLMELVTNEVTVKVHVLRSFMKHWVASYVSGGLTVTLDKDWDDVWDIKFVDKSRHQASSAVMR